MNIVIVGAGSFGTALSNILAKKKDNIILIRDFDKFMEFIKKK